MANNRSTFIPTAAHDLGQLRAAKQEWSARLLRPELRAGTESIRALSSAATPAPNRNVVGVGIGEKVADGKPTGVMAVKFFVRTKYPENQLTNKDRLPKTINGLSVDVEQSGTFRRFAAGAATAAKKSHKPNAHHHITTMPNPRTKIRPAQPGCSIGFRDPHDQFVMAGTFGALVKDSANSYALSNNHVLADENRLPAGSPIFQPGLLDGGNKKTDQVAELTRAVMLQAGVSNKVDCAIAKVSDKALVTNAVLYIGAPQGTTQAAIDMIVHKFGRTTSYRAGRVTSIDTDVTVEYDTGNFMFASQIIITGLNNQMFSDAGDSGSLILERGTNKAVALLFAGSPSYTIANHVSDVLQALNVTLA